MKFFLEIICLIIFNTYLPLFISVNKVRFYFNYKYGKQNIYKTGFYFKKSKYLNFELILSQIIDIRYIYLNIFY